MRRPLAVALAALLVAVAARADSRAPPWAHETWSPSRAYVLRVAPSQDPRVEDGGTMAAYEVLADGREALRWVRPGYVYPFEVFLADDGKTIAVVDAWPTLREGASFLSKPGVVFLRGENTVAYHLIADLVSDHRAIRCSVSHFDWLDRVAWSRDGALELRTVDGGVFRFDPLTGAIASSTPGRKRADDDGPPACVHAATGARGGRL